MLDLPTPEKHRKDYEFKRRKNRGMEEIRTCKLHPMCMHTDPYYLHTPHPIVATQYWPPFPDRMRIFLPTALILTSMNFWSASTPPAMYMYMYGWRVSGLHSCVFTHHQQVETYTTSGPTYRMYNLSIDLSHICSFCRQCIVAFNVYISHSLHEASL